MRYLRHACMAVASLYFYVNGHITDAWSNNTIVNAPTGYDNKTNGFIPQKGPFGFDLLNETNVVAGRSFDDNRFIFEEFEVIDDGLGPVYNAQSCRECHQNVVTGGGSQITELRMATNRGDEPPGGTLIHSRAIDPTIVEQPGAEYQVRSLRLSTSTLGGGFVESIADDTLRSIRDSQAPEVRGMAVMVPVLEADGRRQIGRFGWKGQHASLESFAADAYLNEMGITSHLLRKENTSMGRDVSRWDKVADPEDDGADLKAFADFMRATKAPPRGPITPSVRAGQEVFAELGCAACHTPAIVTAPPGTVVNGGTFSVPPTLGNKRIHPYSDFLLHNIGTGDGIQTRPGEAYLETTYKMRTAPLWGLRTRNRLMHDGLSSSLNDAIARHAGQAQGSRRKFNALSPKDRNDLFSFLGSL